MSLQSLCETHEVTHKRYAITRGGGAAQVRAASTVASGMKCFVQPLNARKVADLKKKGQRITHQVFFSSNPSADVEDWFEWNDGTETHKLFVEGETNAAGLNRLWRVDCSERQDGDA